MDALRTAQALSEATKDVLYELYKDDIQRRQPGASLHCRTGMGYATNCSAVGMTPPEYRITYGQKMVAMCMVSGRSAAAWTHGREVLKRGYFGGKLTFLGSLANATCHEFAHLLKAVEGTGGPPHGEGFYKQLNRLHQDGVADLVREFIETALRRESLPLDFVGAEAATTALVGYPSGATLEHSHSWPSPRPRIGGWHVGDAAQFCYRGNVIRGRVIRVNSRTLSIVQDGCGPHMRWRVGPRHVSRPDAAA